MRKSFCFSLFLGYASILFTVIYFHNGIFIFNINALYPVFFMLFYLASLSLPLLLFCYNIQLIHLVKELNALQVNSPLFPFVDSFIAGYNNIPYKVFPLWEQYKNTFTKESGIPPITYTKAENFFYSESLINLKFSFPIIKLIRLSQGTFIGLGILGTFIGFSSGIPNILDISGINDLQPLFNGLKTAFNTSIVGVFSSIIYNFLIVTPLLHSLENASDSLCNFFDSNFYQDKDTATLATLKSSDPSQFSKVLGEMTAVFSTFQNNFSPINQTLLSLPSLIEGSNNKFLTAENDLYDKLNTLSSNFASSIDNLTRSYSSILNSIQNTLTKIEAARDSLDGVLSRTQLNVDITGENLTKSLEQYKTLTEETRTMLEDFKVVDQSISDVFSEVQKGLTQYVTQANQNLNSLLSHFSDATTTYTQGFTGSCAALNSVCSEMKNSINDLDSTLLKVLKLNGILS